MSRARRLTPFHVVNSPAIDKKTSIIAECRPRLELYDNIYRDIHQNPDLSLQEARTADIVAKHLSNLDFDVQQHIGGCGIVGVLQNGPGKTVLLRADMDALPISEDTNLPYASSKKAQNAEGKEVSVMHACGHDMHTTVLMATAQLLHSARSRWNGTLICLFQPNEETACGAQAMVDDGLYKKVPVPDIVLGQHIMTIKAGSIALRSGPILAGVDSFDIRIFGKGGHSARPDICVDPIVTAGHILTRLQTIVSREVKPGELGVISCGSIHGGSAANIIPDHVDMKITARAYSTQIQERLLKGIERVIKAECTASGATQEPSIKSIMHAPPTINAEAPYLVLNESFQRYFHGDLCKGEAKGASEDFSILATSCNRPYLFWNFGCVDPEQWAEADRIGTTAQIPGPHTARFAPAIQPTMRTAVDSFSLAALTFLGV
ncbi:hypothetical protein MMC17_009344 [Xylographa soralifera]|nr:hypothetical protein [Xylographa soralifera]